MTRPPAPTQGNDSHQHACMRRPATQHPGKVAQRVVIVCRSRLVRGAEVMLAACASPRIPRPSSRSILRAQCSRRLVLIEPAPPAVRIRITRPVNRKVERLNVAATRNDRRT
jgi:hypothetical protein